MHRYTGLFMAAFLFLAGVTGALLAFHDELDDAFNHQLAQVAVQDAPMLSIATLHDKVMVAYPSYSFSSLPTHIDAGKSAVFAVDRWRGSERVTPEPDIDDVYVNPYTGEVLGARNKDTWALNNVMAKVYWLHRDLLLGDTGKLVLGIAALLWTLNCFIGFYLTLPRAINKKMAKKKEKRASWLKRWQPAWRIRTKRNFFKFNYDLHHAFGLWLWLMLLVIAWSSVGFNLPPVYQPVMQTLVGFEPFGFSGQGTQIETPAIDPDAAIGTDYLSRAQASDYAVTKVNSVDYLQIKAHTAAQQAGYEVQGFLGMRWAMDEGQWQLRFKTDADIGKQGGASSISVDAKTGEVVRVRFGSEAGAGDKTDQWLSTLHMGHIGQGAGHLLYQLFLSLIGVAVALLSVSGVYLWYKGRQARQKSQYQQQSAVKLTRELR
ncbi:PepSY domain-containing protein [Psychrobacter aestuarii]|uniref:PepSY domain-containing protein n=1 Tax=Psychrobacter aestuarii TaxID=556327 RepID=A0ABP3F8J5_9GAMM